MRLNDDRFKENLGQRGFMLKAICKKCVERGTGVPWTEHDDLRWKNGSLWCFPWEEKWWDGYPMEEHAPPQDCYFYLEHLILNQKDVTP